MVTALSRHAMDLTQSYKLGMQALEEGMTPKTNKYEIFLLFETRI